jgi:hypothetical protein
VPPLRAWDVGVGATRSPLAAPSKGVFSAGWVLTGESPLITAKPPARHRAIGRACEGGFALSSYAIAEEMTGRYPLNHAALIRNRR